MKNGIHDEMSLSEYMCKQQSIRDSYDNVQYKFICIPDYQPNKSAIIVKAHHCFSDGLGFSAFALAMSGDYDSTSLPALKPQPWYLKFVIFILNPLLVTRTNFEVLGL